MPVPTEIRCNTCGRAATAADRFCGFCGARLDAEPATPTPEVTGPSRPHADRILAALRSATVGEYDVAGEIGRGGMAVVFLAHDLSLNRKVAIKALLPELLYTEGMDRRFKHEARIAAKLDHPNILVIHGVREANDLLFIVMKLVEGLPLSAILKVAGPLPIPIVRLIVRSVADALAYAHGEGVVHRDVKPANIMVDRRGNVVVMDFGIAKAADDAHLTRTGLVIGTPAYMSPEQCLAQAVTSASDQYSLGVVAYELLAGKTPFRGSALEMQWAHATATPPSVRTLRPDCPPELDALVTRMMAKSAADRWPSLLDVSHALADEPSVVNAARAALIALVADVPGRRDAAALPTTPASPVPIGPGPAGVGNATTDPVRSTTASADAPVAPDAPPPAVAPMLTLSRQRIELTAGDAVELIVELEAGDEATDGSSVEWESSDLRVATVSRDGFVTAVGSGLAEVACVWRGRRAVCLVHVSAAVAPAPPSLAPTNVAAPAPTPVPVASSAPARWGPWWLGVAAVAVVAVGLLARSRVGGNTGVSAPNAEPPASSMVAARPTPASAPSASDSASSPVAPGGSATSSARASAPTIARIGGNAGGLGAAGRTPSPGGTVGATPNAKPVSSGRVASAEPRVASATTQSQPAPSSAPPVVPRLRPDSARLTTRADTGSGYGSTRSTSSPATPPPNAATPPAPARDSAADRIPPAPREIAVALFKEFANAVNAQSFSRITGAYTQPNDPAAVKLWQDFLVFVRDYSPRATLRSTNVNATTNPPTITATIDFRWSNDAGFEHVRAGNFTGVGVPIPDGWQLRRVLLGKRFW
jgi:eukaryotic-like serine/threonine-protein kinase